MGPVADTCICTSLRTALRAWRAGRPGTTASWAEDEPAAGRGLPAHRRAVTGLRIPRPSPNVGKVRGKCPLMWELSGCQELGLAIQLGKCCPSPDHRLPPSGRRKPSPPSREPFPTLLLFLPLRPAVRSGWTAETPPRWPGVRGLRVRGPGGGGGRPGSPRHLEPPATEGHSELGGAVESRVNHSVQGPGVSSRRRRGRGVDSRGRPPRLPATTGGGGESAGRAPGSRRRGRPRGPLIARPAPASPDAAPRAPSRSFPTGAFSPTFPAFGAQRIRPTSPPAPGHGVSHRTPADLPRGRCLQDTPPRLGPGPGGRSLR